MKKIGTLSLIGLASMAVLSFANFSGASIAGLAVIVGILFFFIIKKREKEPARASGLDFRSIGRDLKKKSIWFWIILPVVMNAVSIGLALLFLPEYLEHVVARTESFLSWNLLFLMLLQLAVFALGEEIAWRAYFQKQVSKMMPIVPALLFSSLLFALGHVAFGEPVVVAYDLFFVFVNSFLYGVVFYKTNNAWISAIAHFLANLSSVIFFLWFY